jgi:peptidoglycan/xylan/chitin deacetylase (PgdA/CDA1 family)
MTRGSRLPGLLCWPLAALLGGPTTPGVKGYRVFFATCRAPQCERPLVALRAFRRGVQEFVLVVDPESLDTQVLPMAGLKVKKAPWREVRNATRATPYGRALTDAERTAAAEQDAGIVHALPPGKGVVLTIDLCPSTRPLDRRLFAAILAEFEPEERPVPLGIAITGLWMLEHAKDLAWLRELEGEGEIAATWINHSFNHRYRPDLPLSRNFLREPGTDIDFEVLATESALIDNDLRPSAFFRFPGLVSDPKLFRRVISFGLIPVGSDAWLAKNQAPSPGSIVLVHGNGNEPIGIEKFLALVKTERKAIRGKDWLLFDLRQSVSRAEEVP